MVQVGQETLHAGNHGFCYFVLPRLVLGGLNWFGHLHSFPNIIVLHITRIHWHGSFPEDWVWPSVWRGPLILTCLISQNSIWNRAVEEQARLWRKKGMSQPVGPISGKFSNLRGLRRANLEGSLGPKIRQWYLIFRKWHWFLCPCCRDVVVKKMVENWETILYSELMCSLNLFFKIGSRWFWCVVYFWLLALGICLSFDGS